MAINLDEVTVADLEAALEKKKQQQEKLRAKDMEKFANELAKQASDKGYGGTAAQFLAILKGGSTSTGTRSRNETFKYLDDDGVKYKRPPRAEGKTWTEKQKQKYVTNYKEKYGNMW